MQHVRADKATTEATVKSKSDTVHHAGSKTDPYGGLTQSS